MTERDGLEQIKAIDGQTRCVIRVKKGDDVVIGVNLERDP